MPSKLQQVAAMLSGLDICELEGVMVLARRETQMRPRTVCKFLALPAELRNISYELVAREHLNTHLSYQHNETRCAPFSTNKQLRVEFMDLCYSEQLVKNVHLASVEFVDGDEPKISWKAFDNQRFRKLLLDGGKGIEVNLLNKKYTIKCATESFVTVETWAIQEGRISGNEISTCGTFDLVDPDSNDLKKKPVFFQVTKNVITAKGLDNDVPTLRDFDELLLRCRKA